MSNKAKILINSLNNKIRAENINSIKELILQINDEKGNLNQSGLDKNTPLVVACFKNNIPIAKELIDHGANVNQYDEYQNSPLNTAISCHGTKMVKFLIDHNVDVDQPNRYDEAPLLLALNGCDWDMVDLLIINNADIDQVDDDDYTILMRLISESNDYLDNQKAELLIDKYNANINYINKNNHTALSIAAQKNNYELINFLLKAGASIDDNEFRKYARMNSTLINLVNGHLVSKNKSKQIPKT